MIVEFFQEMLKKFMLRVHVNELGLVLFWKKKCEPKLNYRLPITEWHCKSGHDTFWNY